MEKPKVAIALDFDGVIGDSIGDSFVQSVLAFRDMGGNVSINAAAEKRFRAGRPFAKNADRYYTIIRLIQENPHINFKKMTQQKFDAEFRKDGVVKGKRFDQLVTQHRLELAAREPEKWLALQRIFPGIKRLIGNLQKKHVVFIASVKDKKLITQLLKRSGINIPEQNIVSGSSKDKVGHIKKVSQNAGVPVSKVILIDDSLNFLRDAKKVGAEVAMAKWGYSSRIQRKQAKREGISLIRIPRVFGMSLTLWSRLRKMRRKK